MLLPKAKYIEYHMANTQIEGQTPYNPKEDIIVVFITISVLKCKKCRNKNIITVYLDEEKHMKTSIGIEVVS